MENKNTSRNRIVLLVVIVLLVAGGLYLYSVNQTAAPTVPTPTPVASVATSTSAAPTSTISNNSSTWQAYHSKSLGLTFNYPPGWTLGPNTPVSVDNFNHAYAADGSIPLGGAEIDMASTTAYASVNVIIATELLGATGISSSSVSVGNTLCAEYRYQSTYVSGVPSNNMAVYCLRGYSALYKFYLSYRAADPKGAQNVFTFGQVLESIQFTGQ